MWYQSSCAPYRVALCIICAVRFERLQKPKWGGAWQDFAVCCIGGTIGAGGLFQANQAYQQALVVTE
ncbi:MAG: hypothetical protein IPH22_13360 [Nitrosomonas sp.]|nr:hypothetical protein [Nitrosomonas sp.]